MCFAKISDGMRSALHPEDVEQTKDTKHARLRFSTRDWSGFERGSGLLARSIRADLALPGSAERIRRGNV